MEEPWCRREETSCVRSEAGPGMEGRAACGTGDGKDEAERQESDGAEEVEETGAETKALRNAPPARPTTRRPAVGEPREGEQVQRQDAQEGGVLEHGPEKLRDLDGLSRLLECLNPTDK